MELSFERKGTGRSVDEKNSWLMELCLKLRMFAVFALYFFFEFAA